MKLVLDIQVPGQPPRRIHHKVLMSRLRRLPDAPRHGAPGAREPGPAEDRRRARALVAQALPRIAASERIPARRPQAVLPRPRGGGPRALARATTSSPASSPSARAPTTWSFYEGPPTANGQPGSHHVLARVFKDIYPRYQDDGGPPRAAQGAAGTATGCRSSSRSRRSSGSPRRTRSRSTGSPSSTRAAASRSSATSRTGTG